MIDIRVKRPRSVPWQEFRREVEAIYKPPVGNRATWCKVRQVLEALERLGVATTYDLTPQLVSSFVASRPPGQSPHTLKALLSTVRAVCTMAQERRYVAASPFALVKMSKWVKTRPPAGKRCPTAEEVRRVLELLESEASSAAPGWQSWRAARLLALVKLVALSGLRATEALRLRLEDLDLSRGVIHVRPNGKALKTAASEAAIAMPLALGSALEAWLPRRLEAPASMSVDPSLPWLIPGAMRRGPWQGGPMGHRPVDCVKAAGERAGVPGLTLQSLRRAFVTHAVESGIPVALVARQCRHTEAVSREWYLARTVDALRSALGGFDYR